MKLYRIGKYILVWEYDEHESNVANQPENNLYIVDLWNMKDTLGRDELCTGVSVKDNKTFVFSTFSCINYEMIIENNSVKCISEKFVK